ncbi:hypothetical protein KI387_005843, partial [Taxus chinensis]
VVSRASSVLGGWKALKTRPCNATFAVHHQHQPQPRPPSDGTWSSIKNVVKSRGGSMCVSPEDSLKQGQWVKLICGASFEDVAEVRNLSLVYTLAGEFDPEDCPVDCSRPCERVCPAEAIKFEIATLYNDAPLNAASAKFQGGVISERCYGCGRCLPVCPYDKIRENTYVRTSAAVAELLQRSDVDAIEIHTSAGHLDSFRELWNNLSIFIKQLKLIALDGRPMSGDIGKGATREAVPFAARVAATRNRPPGFLQLAGGTNSNTIESLKRIGLFRTASIRDCGMESENRTRSYEVGKQIYKDALIAGVAYGGYARKVVGRVLCKMYNFQDSYSARLHIEQHPHLLLQALEEAVALVGPIKGYGLH